MAVRKDHFVVAIGASAGGLEAIHEFFDHMPNSSNITFVIIQHLSSDYKSLLVELVSKHTRMRVYEAENNTPIEKNCIYVIPNNKLITIEKNKLQLEEKRNSQSPNTAIDTFLLSLAKTKAEHAIAIILSGTGTDGSRGIEAIKTNGGVVIVQDPNTAKFDGMPNSAIQLGIADFVLAPSEMPDEIINYIREPELAGKPQHIDEKILDEIFSLIHNAVGFDFHYYKLPTILRRIVRRMVQHDIETPQKYLELLRKSEEECKQLGNDFLIGVTRFFRDRESFDELESKVIIPLVQSKSDGSAIKVWVCACSTGEEAYSVAILLNKAIEDSGKNIEIKIFATDVDEVSIEIAAKGAYSKVIETDIDKGLLDKYFSRTNDGYQILQKVRKQIVFARHDVIRDPPFINNDLVTCRNMLIYINPHLQQKILSLLLFAISRNGYLFLGPSEHSMFIRENVDELSNKWKLYRKVRDTKISTQSLAHIAERSYRSYRKNNGGYTTGNKTKTIWDAIQESFNEDLSIAAFFIDKSYNIRESAGNYEKFLSLPKKTLQLNLLGMIPPELYFLMSTEIKRAWKDQNTIILDNLKLKKDNKIVYWQAVIRPMEPFTLVIINEQRIVEKAPSEPVTNEIGTTKDKYIVTLETELEEVRNNLDLAVEDLETTNEELQSSNEELLSANEELQSSNEELQSLNEELHTLNTEHQLKIKELVELNDDLNNYFRSTDIAQIFLDKNLNIRKYNPASAVMINFIDSDIGRPLSHISNNIRYGEFLADVRSVMSSKETLEKEVQLVNGKNMLMRIMPYLNRDRQMNGVVIAFVDITVITQLNNTIRAVLNSSPGYILAFEAVRSGKKIDDFILQIANADAANLLGRSVVQKTNARLKADMPFLATPELFEQYVQVVETDTAFHKDVYHEEEQKWFSLIAVKMMDGFVATVSDITAKKRSEQKLKKNYLELIATKDNLKKVNEELETKVTERTRALAVSEERFRLVANATNDALWDWDLVHNTVWWSETFFKLFGYENTGVTNREFWLGKVHPDDAKGVLAGLYEGINNGSKEWRREYRFKKDDDEYAYILDRAYILHDENGTPYRMLGSMFDVTDLKVAEQKLSTMNEQLEKKVVERTQELEKINNALELSNNDLQQFASVASHDLQEPLRKIQMFSKMIKETIEENVNLATDEIDPLINKIIHSSDRMRSLITDVLNYSRLSESNNFEMTDLNEILKGTLEDFEIIIAEKKAIIESDNLPTLPVIPGQIRQVFQNLISNALKFSKNSEPPLIRITSKPLAKRSFMSMAQEDGPFYSITISDNGIGFDPQFASTIFNLFQRLHSKDKFEGTGIGLAITKKIIEKHNGLIRADSAEDRGATFVIILPSKQNLNTPRQE